MDFLIDPDRDNELRQRRLDWLHITLTLYYDMVLMDRDKNVVINAQADKIAALETLVKELGDLDD